MKHMLDESWVLDGQWCEPRKVPAPEWVSGTLEYSPEGGLQLKVNRAFSAAPGQGHPRIIGSASGVGPCTLIDAYTNNLSIGAGKRSTVIMSHAILGAELSESDDRAFYWSASVLGNLEEWIGWRPIKQDVSWTDLSSLAFRYEQPASLEAVVPSLNATVSATSGISTESDGWQRSTLVHTAMFSVEVANREHQ